MKRFIASALFTLSTITAFEALAWTTYGEVNDVISHDGAYVIFTTITDGSCPNPGAFYWYPADEDAKDMFSIALAALMSGKKVRLTDSGVAAECNGFGAAKATHLWVTK